MSTLELKARERKLRYQAKKKGLCIHKESRKGLGQSGYVSGSCYLISGTDSPLVIASFNYPLVLTGDYRHDIEYPLEAAEDYVACF